MAAERSALKKVIEQLNVAWGEYLDLRLDLLGWETHSRPGVGRDAQDVINHQVGDEYDIFVGIFWHRFGTPTGRAGSGTEEEFERAYRRHREYGGVPAILLYFKAAHPPPSAVDTDQLQRLSCFRARSRKRGVYDFSFCDLDQFKTFVFLHLSREVQAWLGTPAHRSRRSPSQGTQQQCSRLFQQSLGSVNEAVAATDLMRDGMQDLRMAMAETTRSLEVLLSIGEDLAPRDHRARVDATLDGLVPAFRRFTDIVRAQTPVFRTAYRKSMGDFATAAVMQVAIGALHETESKETLSGLRVAEDGLVGYEDSTKQLMGHFQRLPKGTARLDQARGECLLVLSELATTFAFALETMSELIRQLRGLTDTAQHVL